MISWLLTSALLSGIGWLLYIIRVKSYATLRQRKLFIYMTLAGSLLIPLIAGIESTPITEHSQVMAPLEWGEKITSTELQQFCNCVTPDYGHRISYKANATLNWLILHKSEFLQLIIATITLIGIHLLCQTLYLIYLVRTGQKTPMKIGEMQFLLLRHKRLPAIGAFQLLDKYIIWQDGMAHMSDTERAAIYRHELSHLKQRNTLEKIVLRLILCIWFFNPFHYFFRSELGKISEFLADDAGAELLGSKKAYAHLLLKVQQWKQLPSLVTGIGKTFLAVRIARLLETPSEKSKPSLSWMLLFVILLQFSCASPLLNGVDHSLQELGAYEEIFHKVDVNQEDAIYCTDCESVCQPGQ